MDWAKFAQSTTVGVIGLVLVVTACVESITKGQIDPALLTLVAAVIATYFTGTAVRQVNGAKVDALTQSVMALHARWDSSGVPPVQSSAQNTTNPTA